MKANAAIFTIVEKPSFLSKSLAHILKIETALVISDQLAQFELDQAIIEVDHVFSKLADNISKKTSGVMIDMRWALANMEAVTSLERWGAVAQRIATELNKPVVSIYDQDLIIEEQMQAAFRAHSHFLAPSGLYDNPYWIPAEIIASASDDQQLGFMLSRVVPDYKELTKRRKSGEMLARGATPSWLAKSNLTLTTPDASARWHIHCFGKMRVFIGGKPVEWRIAGATPKKTRTVFAYLLQAGAKGAHADQISELLWPDEEDEQVKRSRLHHTIAMLRKTLGTAESVVRAGDYYSLHPPAGSWIDIDTFEQTCRRGLSLFKKGQHDAALQVYLTADQLYEGDLFEDLPREYAESEQENWCMSRRIWLREMALKLQLDITRVLQRSGRSREALDHCMKALSLEPASDEANVEAMRIFKTQGREEAVQRQYRQYKQALATMGASESVEAKSLLSELTNPKKNQSDRI